MGSKSLKSKFVSDESLGTLVFQYFLLTLGAFVSAIAVIVFEVPAQIAPGGVSGIAIILNHLIGTPIGLVVLLGNIPIQIVAYRMLGGWQVVFRTMYTVVLYSVMIDMLTPYFPPEGISDNALLNALYGGIFTGIGVMIIIRGGGTLGGTSTLGRVLQERYGIPLGSSALYTDSAVIVLAGVVFGWEGALYAMIALYVGGVSADYFLEGPSVIRTAVIITDYRKEVSEAILKELGRGVTAWEGTGMFTDKPHAVLYVTMSRAQVNALRSVVLKADPAAFLVIGQGHTAYGHGFKGKRNASTLEM
jgi:uncharacterized membrane-anchored protein YitT (DUF2179 family)